MIKRFEESIIYICCPAQVVTGGPEALHQFYYYLKKNHFNCCMAYFGYNGQTNDLIPERYRQYCDQYILIDEVIDDEKNIVVLPESKTSLQYRFQKAQKCIWWLSMVYCDALKPSIRQFFVAVVQDVSHFSLRRTIDCWKRLKYACNKKKFEHISAHFAASKYAYETLSLMGLHDVEYLVEPISKDFLDAGMYIENNEQRKDVILYNPTKKSRIIKKLLKRNQFQFLPLKGFKPNELIELYRKTKLYVDFGPFGGPERIPKETVYNGCVILVGNRNAAKNDFDVAIDTNFKIDHYNNVAIVTDKIKYMLSHYDEILPQFDFFRQHIEQLEEDFEKSIVKIFQKKANE